LASLSLSSPAAFFLFVFLLFLDCLYLSSSSSYSPNIYWPIVSTLSATSALAVSFTRFWSYAWVISLMGALLALSACFWPDTGVCSYFLLSTPASQHHRMGALLYMGAYLSLTTFSSFKFFVI
jgi:hypothetical protein